MPEYVKCSACPTTLKIAPDRSITRFPLKMRKKMHEVKHVENEMIEGKVKTDIEWTETDTP